MNLSERIEEYLESKFNPGRGQWIHLNSKSYTDNIMAIIKNCVDDEIMADIIIENYERVPKENEEKRKSALKEFRKILK